MYRGHLIQAVVLLEDASRLADTCLNETRHLKGTEAALTRPLVRHVKEPHSSSQTRYTYACLFRFSSVLEQAGRVCLFEGEQVVKILTLKYM